MNTKQIIDEMEKEFEDVAYHEVVYGNPVGTEEGFKDCIAFIHSYTHKLIESVAEEMKYIVALHRLSAWSPQDKDLELISKGSKTTADAITDDIDLKVKEIINQISK